MMTSEWMTRKATAATVATALWTTMKTYTEGLRIYIGCQGREAQSVGILEDIDVCYTHWCGVFGALLAFRAIYGRVVTAIHSEIHA